MYEILRGRKRAYECFTKAVFQSKQSHVAEILIAGFMKEGISRPLTFCDINIPHENFASCSLAVRGKPFKIEEIFPDVDTTILQNLFQSVLCEVSYYNLLINAENPFVLVNETIPCEPPFYVSRNLSNRIKILPKIFKETSPDIYVFKNITRIELSSLAKPELSAASNTQLEEISSRFIYLDHEDDWVVIQKMAKVPVHLIKYESDKKIFILENTKHFEILKKFNSDRDRVYMTEKDFVKQYTEKLSMSSGFCICDTPGMGKTLLLASIARRLAGDNIKRIIAFIKLVELMENSTCPNSIVTNSTTNDASTQLLWILRHVLPSEENSTLLLKLIENNYVTIDLFFDGFDEIPTKDVKLASDVFQQITSKFSNVKIVVTSRPHMRQELETTLQVIAYDILPFDNFNQVAFLVDFWSHKMPRTNRQALENYATRILKVLKKTLSQSNHDITGIPLQCQLIAEVHQKDAKIYCDSNQKDFRCLPRTICEMYTSFLDKRIREVAEFSYIKQKYPVPNNCLMQIFKQYHISRAWKLLFPNDTFPHGDRFNVVHQVEDSDIYKVGIIQQRLNANISTSEFVHRTFAEYIVAEFISQNLFCDTISKNYGTFEFLLEVVFHHGNFLSDKSFRHPVILYFLNSLLKPEVNGLSSLRSIEIFCEQISPDNLFTVLCSCCQYNVIHVFELFEKILQSCDSYQLQEYVDFFTQANSHKFLCSAIEFSEDKFVLKCFTIVKDIFRHNIMDLCKINLGCVKNTLLQLSVSCNKYGVVEFLMEQSPLKEQNILKKCVSNSYNEHSYHNRMNILELLLNKDKSLIEETPGILIASTMHLELMKTLIRAGADLTATTGQIGTGKNRNVVQFAAEFMSSTDYNILVEFLLKDCNASYLFKETKEWKNPLPYIIQKAKLLPQTLQMLLNIPGVDILMVDHNGDNLLCHAVYGGNIMALKVLVDRWPDCKTKTSWKAKLARGKGSLLHVAAQQADEEMISCLISYHMDPNIKDKMGDTPVHKLFRSKCFDKISVAKVLAENGARLSEKNYNDETILHLAAANQVENVTQYLISTGLSVNDGDKFGNTPLHLSKTFASSVSFVNAGANIFSFNNQGLAACISTSQFLSMDEFNKMVSLWFSQNPSSVEVTNEAGDTILHELLKRRTNISVKLLEKLVGYPEIQVDQPNKKGVTPICYAANWCTGDLLACLIKNGANVLAKDENGFGLLHIAVQTENFDLVQYLSQFTDIINQTDNHGNTPLHFCKSNHLVKCLLKNDANVLAKNNDGNTCAHILINNFSAFEPQKKIISSLTQNDKFVELFNMQNRKGRTAVHICLTSGLNQYLLGKILVSGINVNQIDNNGDHLMLLAMENYDVDILKTMINLGGDYELVNAEGRTMLHFAVYAQKIEMVCFCLELGLDPNKVDVNGQSPFWLAAKNFNYEIMEIMIKKGANQNETNFSQQNLLHFAVKSRHSRFVEFCLEHSINPHQRDNCGNTPFFEAAEQPKRIAWEQMIMFGVDHDATNDKNQNILHIAVRKMNMVLLRRCIEIGVNPNQVDIFGLTPLIMAANSCEIQVLKELINAGADISFVGPKNQNIFHILVQKNSVLHISFCQGLGLDPNQKDINGNSPFMLAVKYCDNVNIEAMLQLKVDYSSVDNNGMTVLHISIKRRNKRLSRLCLTQGMDPFQKNINGMSPFFFAANLGYVWELKEMIKFGADRNSTNELQQNIFHIAAEIGNEKFIKFCFQQSVDPNLRDKFGNSPFLLAAKNNTAEIMDRFVNHGSCIRSKNLLDQNILHIACQSSNRNVAKYCRPHYTILNQEDKNGKTPLFLAAEAGSSQIVNFLKKSGADLLSTNQFQQNILHIAVQKQCHELVEYCIINRVDVHLRDVFGLTPYWLAVDLGDVQTLTVMLNYNVEYQALNKHSQNMFHLAAQNHDKTLIEFCMQLKMSANEADHYGNTPILLAAKTCSAETFENLVKYGCNINHINIFGQNIFHIASKHRNMHVLNYCLEKRMDYFQLDKNGFSPLFLAVNNGDKEAVSFFFDAGVDTNVINQLGQNLLHIAILNWDLRFIQFCLEIGVDLNQKDLGGNSPFLMAGEQSDMDTLKAFLKFGADYTTINKKGQNIYHVASNKMNKDGIFFCRQINLDLSQPDNDGNSPFLLAARKGNANALRTMMKWDADIKSTNNAEQNIFHIAAKERNVKLVKFALRQHLSAHLPDKNGKTPFFLVAETGDIKSMQAMITHGCDLNMVNLEGRNILHIAVQRWNKDFIQYCLEIGVDQSQRDLNGSTPLLLAAKYCDVETVYTMIRYGADFQLADSGGQTIFHIAAALKYKELIRYCHQLQLDPNLVDSNGYSPFLLAARKCDADTIRRMIKYGADFQSKTSTGENVSHIAACSMNKEVIHFCMEYEIGLLQNSDNPIFLAAARFSDSPFFDTMIKKGAEWDQCNIEGQNIFHIAVKQKNVSLIQFCFQNNVDPNKSDIRGNTPVMLGFKSLDRRLLRIIIEMGADCYSLNDLEQNILHIATANRNRGAVRYCLELGIDPNEPDLMGYTPLFLAASNNDVKTVDLFIKWGVNPNSTNQFSQNILHIAVQNCYAKFISYCLKSGVNPNQRDANGCSPFFQIAEICDDETLNTFRKRGADFRTTNNSGQNILHIACNTLNVSRIAYCLEIGLNPNEKDKFGKSSIDIINLHSLRQDARKYFKRIKEAKSILRNYSKQNFNTEWTY